MDAPSGIVLCQYGEELLSVLQALAVTGRDDGALGREALGDSSALSRACRR